MEALVIKYATDKVTAWPLMIFRLTSNSKTDLFTVNIITFTTGRVIANVKFYEEAGSVLAQGHVCTPLKLTSFEDEIKSLDHR